MTINKFYQLANQNKNKKINLRPNPRLSPLPQNLRLSIARPSQNRVRLSILANNKTISFLNVQPRNLWLLNNNSYRTSRNNRRGGKHVQVLYLAHGETNRNFRERGLGEYLRRLANNLARRSGFHGTNQLSTNLEVNSNSNSNAPPAPLAASGRIMTRLGFRRVPIPNSEIVTNNVYYFRKVY